MTRIFLGLILLAAIPLIAVGDAIRDRFLRKRAEGWSEAEGRIESGAVSGARGTFYPTLSYSYSVNGEWYSGSVEDCESFTNLQKARDFVDAHTGKSILVRYDPNRPEKSAAWIREEIHGS